MWDTLKAALANLKLWGIAGAVILLLLLGNWLQFQAGQRTREELGQVKAALSLAESALGQLRRLRAEEAQLVVDQAQKQEELETTNRGLEQKLRRAMRNAKSLNLDTVLPDSITDALCLRWNAASGKDHLPNGNAPSGADAGAGDTVAALCAGWRGKVALGDVAEWAGLLLDHAGLERLDKEGLRQWVEGAKNMGKAG